MAQVVECLLSKCEALSPNPSAKKEEDEEKLFNEVKENIDKQLNEINNVGYK
jgi:hypothetical protein